MKSRKRYQIEQLEVIPDFDMELYMLLSQSRRIDGATAALVDEYWTKWRDNLGCRRIVVGDKGWVLVWLGESVEREVNTAWEISPTKAFTMNSLAQAMCMAMLREVLPEVAMAGCAPVPKPNPDLKAALKELGVPWKEEAVLSRQYAMLTPHPWRGGCDTCLLQPECPKLRMEAAGPGGAAE